MTIFDKILDENFDVFSALEFEKEDLINMWCGLAIAQGERKGIPMIDRPCGNCPFSVKPDEDGKTCIHPIEWVSDEIDSWIQRFIDEGLISSSGRPLNMTDEEFVLMKKYMEED